MKRCAILIAGLLLVFAAGYAWAYPMYSQNGNSGYCAACHGDFRATIYNSLSDGQNWGNLHNLHRNTMLSGDCGTCHSSAGNFPVLLNSSAGGNGLSPISCVGCHGRAEDNTASNPNGYGAGLRQHHYRAGVTICTGCHLDADPAKYTPVGENVLPPYYSDRGINHPNIPADSCNPAGVEDFVGIVNGLDNDGDGIYDLNDSDCKLLVTAPSSLDFGSISPGSSSSPQTLIVTNGFNTTVAVSGMALTGTDEAEFSLDVGDGTGGTCGPTPSLVNGTSCTVSVTFSPSTSGVKSANMEISSDGGSPDVTLSGEGLGTGGNHVPTAPQLVTPDNDSIVPGPDVVFGWNRSTDLDGDTVTYDLYVCNGDNTFASICNTPVNSSPLAASSAQGSGTFFARSGVWLLFVGVALAGGLSRKRMTALLLALLLISGMFIVSCGGGGGGGGGNGNGTPVQSGDINYTVQSLATGATYYWKVVATDGKDSTESAVWSFTMQ